ncbi:hypothetical protein EV363DRAFT_1326880 [Boletus edulis]|nr:hypothetical protein EV363DRAFT_1326880 [Boletus edulis]
MVEEKLPFDLDITLGALLIGGLFAAAFWGLTSAQTYTYYRRYPSDSRALKMIVAFLWVLDTFDACLTSHIMYHYLVTNYTNPPAIVTPVWSLLIHVVITSVINAIIRFMFAWAVWTLNGGNGTLMTIAGVITLCDIVVGLAITVKAFGLDSYPQLDILSTLFYINFAAGVLGDFLVAIVLCCDLFMSSIRSTDKLFNVLIVYLVATGFFTSVDAILGTVLYVTMRRNFIFIGFYVNLAKMYINSYLALLNAHQRLQEKPEQYTTHSGKKPSLSSASDELPLGELAVRVQTTVDQKSERYYSR